jgi:hypothetical protein
MEHVFPASPQRPIAVEPSVSSQPFTDPDPFQEIALSEPALAAKRAICGRIGSTTRQVNVLSRLAADRRHSGADVR